MIQFPSTAAVRKPQVLILVTWLPLALMFVMMGVEQPALAAVIARMAESTGNLAAFGVAFSIALVIESPVLQLLSAATALATTRKKYERLLEFVHLLALGLTLVHLLVATRPVFFFLTRDVLNVPLEIIENARATFLVLTPISALVAYRRLWQGVLIRYERTVLIPITVVSRLIVTGSVLILGFVTGFASGAVVAASALMSGILAGSVSSFVLARPVIAQQIESPEDETKTPWKELLSFFIPLSMTSVVYLAAQPLLTFGMARSLFPLESLAVWPVLNGLLFVFNSFALSYQEVVVALIGNARASEAELKKFTAVLGIVLSFGLALFAVTGLRGLWFSGVAGLQPDLLPFVPVPLLILIAAPALVCAKSWFRGAYVARHRTGILAKAVIIHSLILLALTWFVPLVVQIPGTTVAAGSLVIALAAECLYLWVGPKFTAPAGRRRSSANPVRSVRTGA